MEEIVTKRITELPEKAELKDDDLWIAGTPDTAALNKITFKNLMANIMRKLLGNSEWMKNTTLAAYPVGAIYLSVNDTNPSILFGGSWSVFAKGRVLVGVDAEQTEFNAAEKTGGAKTHTLSTAQIPSHTHAKGTLVNNTTGNHRHDVARKNGYGAAGTNRIVGPYSYTNIGDPDVVTCLTDAAGNHVHTISGSTAATGSGGAHNNLQPYIACFMWKRTA